MPTFMNSMEIDEAAERLTGDAGRYARYLRDFRDVVDANSDGWAYWAAVWKAGAKLGELVGLAMRVRGRMRPASDMPTAAAFEAACRPIKSICTRRKLPRCTLEAA